VKEFLKTEIETIKKSQRETTLEIGNLRRRSGVLDASITNRIQEIEERISGAEDSIENMDTTIKENAKRS
jgi:prefoldin subunit 5